MSDNFFKTYDDAVETIRADVAKEAYARARYRVQDDFNRDLLKQIADKTEHPRLAATCFVDVESGSNDDLDVHVYNDWRQIDGLFSSNSSFHQSGGKWKSVTEHYGMSKDEFWEKKYFGEEGDKSYGVVDPEWLADNFWDGIYYATNGWPRSDAEFLSVYRYQDVSAISVIEAYYNNYVKSNTFQKYIQEEINSMKN